MNTSQQATQQTFYQLDVMLRFLILATSFFVCGFFIFPTAKILNYWYYLVVIPLTLFNLNKIDWKNFFHNPTLYLILSYLIYCLLSSFWSDPFSIKSLLGNFKHILYLVNFLFLITILQKLPKQIISFATTAFIFIACLSAIISITFWYLENPLNTRLEGFFRSQHAILATWLMCVPALICLQRYITDKSLPRALIFLFLAIPLLVYTLLTQSRGPLIALIAVLGLFLVHYRNKRCLYMLTGLLVLILIDQPIMLRSMITFTFRQHIWLTLWQHVMQHPWFGYGYLTSLQVNTLDAVFSHAHSVYLEMLFLGGFVGFVLQTLMMISILWKGWRHRHNNIILLATIILIFALVCMLSDGGRLITNPRELWISFWLPLFTILTYPVVKKTPINRITVAV